MKEQLLKRSANAVQRAIRHYLNEEIDQFLIQAGVSFELLGKSKLAAIHPSLIVERDFDSLLLVCAAGKHSKRPPWKIRTIGATEVLKRCIQLQPDLNEFATRLTLLAEFRNSAIHLGEVGEAEAKQLFHAYLAGAALIVDEMAVPRQDYFGEFVELVATQLDKSLAEVQRRVAEKLARARDNFQQRYAALDAGHLQGVVKAIEGGYSLTKYEDELIECPACGKLGMISGDYDVDWEVDYDDDGTISGGYPVVTLNPSGFFCNLCRLSLDDASELKAAGLGEPIDLEDVDPADFYEEPDY